jgi:type VI secretion system protein
LIGQLINPYSGDSISVTRSVATTFAATAIALTMSCAIPARNTRLQLQVRVAPDANDVRPVPVDVVFVWDKELAAKVEALSAKEWFDRKPQFRRDDPTEKALTVREWEWVPGQTVSDIDLSVRATARKWLRAIFVFANYRTEGPHRLRLAPGTATIALLKDDLLVEPAGAAKAPVAQREDR